MKTLFTLILLFAFIGCAEPTNSNNPYDVERSTETQSTIKEVENGKIYGTLVEVFEARGHEYISLYKGGLVHSESCPHRDHILDRGSL